MFNEDMNDSQIEALKSSDYVSRASVAIKGRCKEKGIRISKLSDVMEYLDISGEAKLNLKDIFDSKNELNRTKFLHNSTCVWLVIGNNRLRVADMIACNLIKQDFCNNINMDARAYGVTGYSECLNFTSSIIEDLRNYWLLYIKDWNSSIKNANVGIMESLVKERMNIAKSNDKTGYPTIITIDNDNPAFKSLRDKNTWNDLIKVIKTK
jgi:hypothetical protein